jgi:hypothetical protein
MEVGQGPNWGCRAKEEEEKKKKTADFIVTDTRNSH